ncbi:two component transcriptional regulator, LuxR family [Dyadobacter koreensis]|uniref:Two component transcriptional regulator, LuxR family n=1 Tax=Dyadobacter koreensis TaxID=408657 RepID=A0A1H6QR17_9BACT|nr:response regulator transcription factor [Dyadobacter koreensis]SEI46049.1 two component transcriptional regulator, LuxR family [Dyadobacter koreensis]
MATSVVIVDDHELMAQALSGLIQKFDTYEVLFEAYSGQELTQKIHYDLIPDIVLLDIHMPIMDGFMVCEWLKTHYPSVKVLALSMSDKEESIIRMLKCGAIGYLLKGCKPHELKHAMDAVVSQGYYYSGYVASHLINNVNPNVLDNSYGSPRLNEREISFVKLACSELTYSQIADKMCVSPRTVDGYRESVFEKLDVKSRVGMVIKAIQIGIYEVP